MTKEKGPKWKKNLDQPDSGASNNAEGFRKEKAHILRMQNLAQANWKVVKAWHLRHIFESCDKVTMDENVPCSERGLRSFICVKTGKCSLQALVSEILRTSKCLTSNKTTGRRGMPDPNKSRSRKKLYLLWLVGLECASKLHAERLVVIHTPYRAFRSGWTDLNNRDPELQAICNGHNASERHTPPLDSISDVGLEEWLLTGGVLLADSMCLKPIKLFL